MSHRLVRPWALLAAGGFALWAMALAAQAAPTLLGASVTVTLDAPAGFTFDSTPITATNSGLIVGVGPEISAGDLSQVGDLMLPGTGPGDGEFIDFGATDIRLRVLMGVETGDDTTAPVTGVTGWAAGARYIFSGLNFTDATDPSATFSITGAVLSLVSGGNVDNFDAGWVSIASPTSVAFDLASMTFLGDGVGTTAQNFSIRLTVTRNGTEPPPPPPTVPVPGTLALVALALVSARCVQSRRAQRA